MDFNDIAIYLISLALLGWSLRLLHQKGGRGWFFLAVVLLLAAAGERAWRSCGCDGDFRSYVRTLRSNPDWIGICHRMCGIAGRRIGLGGGAEGDPEEMARKIEEALGPLAK